MLLDAFAEARIHGEYQYKQLKLECRKVEQDLATFLITCNGKVVWQFPLNLEILEEPDLFKSYFPHISTAVKNPQEDRSERKISDLKAKMKSVTVKAKIVEIPPKKLVNTKYGWEAYVSNVLLADETGTIRLSLWNTQIDDVAVGDTILLEKTSVATFSGELQLRIGRRGSMSIVSNAS